MANVITYVKKTIPILDKIYKAGSKTSVLDGDISLTQAGSNAHSILIPKIDMDGLSNYGRGGSGYDTGATKLEFQEKEFNYDRGQKFAVDSMDNEETVGLAFGQLSGEFVRTKVIPEIDAFRISTYASKAGTKKTESLSTGKNVVDALRAASNTLEEKEVDPEGRYLFITPTLKALIEDMDTTASREVLKKFPNIVEVPQSRMFTDIELATKGYKAKSTSKNINFIVISKPAVIQYEKHKVNKTISPELNQSSDDWLFFFRAYQICEVKDNKVDGIYASISSTTCTINTTSNIGATQSSSDSGASGQDS